jgi:hypothetical protein
MQRTNQILSSVNMSTGILKNIITVCFNSSNLDTWAPQVCCAANLISVGYLFNKTKIDFTDQIEQIVSTVGTLGVVVRDKRRCIV